jgi:hypothetical protein
MDMDTIVRFKELQTLDFAGSLDLLRAARGFRPQVVGDMMCLLCSRQMLKVICN